MWRKSNLCQKWLWAPCLVRVELTLLVPRARPAIGPGESAVKPKVEITKSCFHCQWCGSSKSWLGQHPREDMSAPDSPAHLHALLQLRGRTAAWPAAAAAASGRACGTLQVCQGCSTTAPVEWWSVQGHWTAASEGRDVVLCLYAFNSIQSVVCKFAESLQY